MDFSLLGFSGVKDLFNVHPIFVHFPVALFPAAFLLYALGTLLKNRSVLFAGRMSLYLALAGTVAALLTGLQAEDSFPHNEVIHHLMGTHEFIGWILLITGSLLTAWSFWHVDHAPKGKWGFLAVLAFAVYLVSQTAEIGGRMVYDEGAAVKPAVSVIAEKEDADEAKEAAEPGEHHHEHGDHVHAEHQHNH